MMNETQEVDVINRLVQWARSQPLVRALVLESSRASENAARQSTSCRTMM